MRKSLEKSLHALGTDYLDYFFIHEPHQTITYIDELQETAARLKSEGKIRAWGLAYMQDQLPLHETYIDNFDLLQFNNSPGVPGYGQLVIDRGNEANILFSPFRGGTKDLKPADKLTKLLSDFPRSVILCSMFNIEHMKQNIALVEK